MLTFISFTLPKKHRTRLKSTPSNLINADNEPSIVDKVEWLSRAWHYPAPNESVEVVETHRSWVFLTDAFAYKLKKPVRGEGFDFSTLDVRYQNCQHEIRLNRRLAENVYLAIVPLTIDDRMRWSIDGDGVPIDWLVKMRKLPREQMLDQRIANANVTTEEIESVGTLLSGFYRRASPVDWSEEHYCRHLIESIANARTSLLNTPFGLPLLRIEHLANELLDFIDEHRAELIQRVRSGRVIDAHGDLRPEHICLETPPVIIDCLEFNRNLRILDSGSELSFLMLECALAGAAEVGERLWQAYCYHTADSISGELRRFYIGFHALLRASLSIAHLRDDVVRQPEKWKLKAMRYLDATRIADLQ